MQSAASVRYPERAETNDSWGGDTLSAEVLTPVFDPDSGGGEEILHLYDAAATVAGAQLGASRLAGGICR